MAINDSNGFFSTGVVRFSAGALCILVVGTGTGLIPVAGLKFPGVEGEQQPMVLATGSTTNLVTDVEEPAAAAPPHIPQPAIPHKAPVTTASGSASGVGLQATLSQGKILRGQDREVFLHCRVNVSDALKPGTERKPVDLVLVLDTSGSMAAAMPLLKRATLGIIERLGSDDRLTIVTYSSSARVVFQGTPAGTASARLERVVAELTAMGGTNISEGLRTGVRALSKGESKQLQRIVLLTDGQANEGVTDTRGLRKIVGKEIRSRNVALSSLGLGASYNEDLLGQLADAGGGLYHYVSSPQGLAKVYKAEVDALKGMVATQAALRIDPAQGVRVQEVCFWNASSDDGAQVVQLGDLARGRSLKVVVRLRVPAQQDQVKVANVSLRFADAQTGSREAVRVPALSLGVTDDPSQANASEVVSIREDLKKIRVAVQLERARQAAQSGDYEEAKVMLRKCKSIAGKDRIAFSAPSGEEKELKFDELADDMDEGRAQESMKKNFSANRAMGR